MGHKIRIIKYILKFVQKLKIRKSPDLQSIRIQDNDAEAVLVGYESAVIRDKIKPGSLKNFRDQDGIIHIFPRITEENP